MNNSDAIQYLRSTKAIRECCGKLYDLGVQGKLLHFSLDLGCMPACVAFVAKVIRDEYPTLAIPYHSRWRHFDVGDVPRSENLFDAAGLSARDELRARFDLAVTSVLLDAGAGAAWSYLESSSGKTWRRSEGLAVASFDLFVQGKFSARPDRPLQADADGLEAFSEEALEQGFQVSASNPLVGVPGRVELLRRLGRALRNRPDIFGQENPRIGNMADFLIDKASATHEIPASQILNAVLEGLGSIWPGRTEIDGINLGDVWTHPLITGEGPGAGMVPFHKLSQWLTYSLLEPLERSGFTISGLDQLTGLPEYRNGGLFLDMGVLNLKDPGLAKELLKPSHPAIVEWRALTVVLLDQTATLVQKILGLSAAQFPLAKVLQGGTWTAGRKIAATRRAGGIPPLQVDSDGTVF
jgi:hypothetical protein